MLCLHRKHKVSSKLAGVYTVLECLIQVQYKVAYILGQSGCGAESWTDVCVTEKHNWNAFCADKVKF